MIEKNIDKVKWSWLTENRQTIAILEKNLNKVEWGVVYPKTQLPAIRLLEQNLESGLGMVIQEPLRLQKEKLISFKLFNTKFKF